MAAAVVRHRSPQQLDEGVATERPAGFDGQAHDEREMLARPKPDRLTGRGNEVGVPKRAQPERRRQTPPTRGRRAYY
jgi:hypothetical protein